ncbi:ribosome biogenesis factor YjgA [Legionella londiniensis]|uniref:Dual-action ribosomal maturation protein DarP n=1 Tax=Legionella londiniensis TaxID=45068 RepID=A0A0W0VNS5_9GAMM|nr:ribosome biogenesis factor YjgA [Legionella londiniensis]KTD21780.1 alpha helix protein [Legionella londiniensis]STX92156.1 alpha helix protein [Legionella londiniensis]
MDEPKSKTQKKREADALQKIGVKFVALSVDKLDKLPLSEPLRKAILDAKALRGHGAIRRQAQLIGKLMRAADSDAILAAYDELMAESKAQTAAFHEAELWREKLIHGGKEALTEFIAQYQPEDIQQLRLLIKKAVSEQNLVQQKGAQKALFRYLRTYLQ